MVLLLRGVVIITIQTLVCVCVWRSRMWQSCVTNVVCVSTIGCVTMWCSTVLRVCENVVCDAVAVVFSLCVCVFVLQCVTMSRGACDIESTFLKIIKKYFITFHYFVQQQTCYIVRRGATATRATHNHAKEARRPPRKCCACRAKAS